MVEYEEKWITVQGVKTRYFETGLKEAPTLVMFHGGAFSEEGICQNALIWERNMRGLAQKFRVFAPDALGHGRTDAPANLSDYTYTAIIAHASAFLDALGIEKAHLLGHDEGALTAVKIGFDFPQRILSCSIISSLAVAPSGDSISTSLLSGPVQPLYTRQSQRWYLDRQSFYPHHIEIGSFLNEAVQIASTTTFKAVRETFSSGIAKNQLTRSLTKLKVENFARCRDYGFPAPVLILWGRNDPLSCLPNGNAWNVSDLHQPEALAHSLFKIFSVHQSITQMKIINEAGHMPFREQPDLFNSMIMSFIIAVDADNESKTNDFKNVKVG